MVDCSSQVQCPSDAKKGWAPHSPGTNTAVHATLRQNSRPCFGVPVLNCWSGTSGTRTWTGWVNLRVGIMGGRLLPTRPPCLGAGRLYLKSVYDTPSPRRIHAPTYPLCWWLPIIHMFFHATRLERVPSLPKILFWVKDGETVALLVTLASKIRCTWRLGCPHPFWKPPPPCFRSLDCPSPPSLPKPT